MKSEASVVFEKEEVNECALVIQLEDLNRLDHPKIKEIIESSGLSVREFGRLLRLEFEPLIGPTRHEVPNSKGEKIEDVVKSIAGTSVGEIEVSDVRLYPSVVAGRDDMSLHLKVGENKGFEVIYALKGEAHLAFPKIVEPVAPEIYTASKEREHIKLIPGTLAIIPAPTANGWSMVGENFSFRYICQPIYSSDFVRKVIDL